MRQKEKLRMAKKSNPLSSSSSVLFVTFSRWDGNVRTPTNGSLDPLRDYLVPRIRKLVIVDQPHPSGDNVIPVIEEHKGKKTKIHKPSWWILILKPWLDTPHTNPHGTYIRFKIRDFLSVIDWGMRDKAKFDYCICLESINTVAAIILRKMGRVSRVVYYVSDYSPKRYSGKFFNGIYLALDRFCATNADYIWDVSPAMQKARIAEGGLDPDMSAPAIHVPNALNPSQIKVNPTSQINKHDLVYMGILSVDNGPDVAIKALPFIKKKFPDVRLHIIGGTDKDYKWLEKIVKKLKLSKNIVRHGFIKSGDEMSKVIRSCAIGLAPYRSIPGSIRYYADAGKMRAYCASGLPIVSSFVPPLGLHLAEKKAAVLARDKPEDFANAIIEILNNPKLYSSLRKNAIIFGRHNTWNNSFKIAFTKMNHGKN